jgi:hypothetical protein
MNVHLIPTHTWNVFPWLAKSSLMSPILIRLSSCFTVFTDSWWHW